MLVGVVSFYEGPQTRQEVVSGFRGGYVSLDACLRLLGGAPQPQPPGNANPSAPGVLRVEQAATWQSDPKGTIEPIQTHPLAAAESEPKPWSPPPQLPQPPCPDGRCPYQNQPPCPNGQCPYRR